MSVTPCLALPHILPAQAQKHVTHNEALERLDALVQLSAEGRAETPPSSPVEGQCWLIDADATAAFEGHGDQIARFRDGTWQFLVPRDGWRLWMEDETLLLVRHGGAWQPAVQQLPMLGIETAADTTNRLALSSPASLFNHAGAGHQLKINKAASGDTASLLFQSGFSGRAEIGTAGSDELSVKVSADGAAWRTAIAVDPSSGRVAFPHGGVREVLAVPRSFYVRTDGNDGNDGLVDSAGRAFATLQRAVDAALALDSGLSDVEIRVAPGTYAGVSVAAALPGRGNLILRGTGSTAAEVVISSAGNAVSLSNGARLDLRKLTVAASGAGVAADNRSRLQFSDVDFGACGTAHMHATDARIVANGNYRITGDAPYHVVAQTRAYITISFRTVTLPSLRAFSGSFVFALSQAIVEAYSCTFTGTATGPRHYAGVAAIIYTGGAGSTYFPGSAAGSVDGASFAQYA
jgi:hypothetical protein